VLAPESDLFEDLDSAGFGEALNTALQSSLANPDSAARATLQWATDLARIPMVAATRSSIVLGERAGREDLSNSAWAPPPR